MPEREPLRIGGMVPFTTLDLPDHLAAVLFCQGCPWRCRYCHNPHLQGIHPPAGAWTWEAVAAWMASRRGLLEGLVFSGGEPLLQEGLPAAVREVRQSGFAVGLHTAGIFPDRLRAVLPEVDWIGFDLKAPFGTYARLTGAPGDEAARESLRLVVASGKPYEVRCTLDPEWMDAEDLVQMVLQLREAGVPRFVLQPCRTNGRPCVIPDSLVAPALSLFPGLEQRPA